MTRISAADCMDAGGGATQDAKAGDCMDAGGRATQDAKAGRVVPQRARDGGFTLLEILLVLGILGMAAVLIIPGLSTLDSPSFNAQVRELSGLFNYARRTAVVQGHPMRVEVWSSEPDDDVPAESAGLAGRWISDGITVEYADSTQRWRAIEEQQAVLFYPEGGSTGGDLRLQQGNRSAILSVDPFSGRVARRDLE